MDGRDRPAAAIKATPLLVNGVLYFSTPDHAYAMDARTGRELWHYTWTRNRGGIHIGNRGVAIYGNTVYFVTPDCNLVALDADTGKEKWFKEICSLEMVYYASVAPLVVKDKLDHRRQRRRPRHARLPRCAQSRDRRPDLALVRDAAEDRTIPGSRAWPNLEAAQHGGGMTWQPITYDPEANLIYVATGNPQPVIARKNRPGANLFTASIVALNADTGKMAWYFQTSPHDTHDLDSTQAAVLFDIPGPRQVHGAGEPRAASSSWSIGPPARPWSRPSSSRRSSSSGTDERGQPVPNPAKDPTPDGTISTNSATNWYPAHLQSADGPVLREREPQLRHLLRLRPQRQSDGMGRRRRRRRPAAASRR